MRLILIFLTIFFSLTQLVSAAKGINGKVSELYVKLNDGLVYLRLNNDPSSSDCANSSSKYFKFYTTDTGGEAAYSFLLSAKASGDDVYVRYNDNGGTAVCTVVYVDDD